MISNFKYFALMYLNEWYSDDKRFVNGITSSDKQTRLSYLYQAANYYKVTRNFAVRDDEARFEGVLEELMKVTGPITEGNVDSEVETLASRFAAKYGKNTISAASKFLWLRFKSPVILFDSRALAWLKLNRHESDKRFHYESYRRQWMTAFNAYKNDINSACEELVRAKHYSLAYAESDNTIAELAASRWFQERVFDKFLWSNGGV